MFLDDFLASGTGAQAPQLEFEQLPFSHPLFIMFSSGTTGAPKCMVHSAGVGVWPRLASQPSHWPLCRVPRHCFSLDAWRRPRDDQGQRVPWAVVAVVGWGCCGVSHHDTAGCGPTGDCEPEDGLAAFSEGKQERGQTVPAHHVCRGLEGSLERVYGVEQELGGL